MSVKALYQSQQDVGKNIKSSKKKYSWKFSIDDKDHTIELFVSSLSGKKKVVHNGRTLREESSVLGSFNYSMTLQNNLLTISSNGDVYDLRINNLQFSHLYHNEKTKKEFQFEDGYNDGSNSQDYYSKLPKPQKQSKPLYREEDQGYDLGLVDDIEKMAPQGFPEQNQFNTNSNQFTKLNIQFKPRDDQMNRMEDNFNQPKFSQPLQQKPKVQATQPFNQQQQVTKNQFSDFANFGEISASNSQNTDNVFKNFGFSFDNQQQLPSQQNPFQTEQKPNPFNQQVFQNENTSFQKQPPQEQQFPLPNNNVVKQQPANLIDFLDEEPVVQQQNTAQQQQKQPQLINQQYQQQQPQQYSNQQQFNKQQIPQPQQQQQKNFQQDLLDAFDEPEPITQKQVTPQQPQFNITQLYQQQQSLPYQTQQNQFQPIYQPTNPQIQNQQFQQSSYNASQNQVQINVKTQSTPFDDLF